MKVQFLAVQDMIPCGKEDKREALCVLFPVLEQYGESTGVGKG